MPRHRVDERLRRARHGRDALPVAASPSIRRASRHATARRRRSPPFRRSSRPRARRRNPRWSSSHALPRWRRRPSTLNDAVRTCSPGGLATTLTPAVRAPRAEWARSWPWPGARYTDPGPDQVDDRPRREFDLRLRALGDVEDVGFLHPGPGDHLVPGRAPQQLGAALEERDARRARSPRGPRRKQRQGERQPCLPGFH